MQLIDRDPYIQVSCLACDSTIKMPKVPWGMLCEQPWL